MKRNRMKKAEKEKGKRNMMMITDEGGGEKAKELF